MADTYFTIYACDKSGYPVTDSEGNQLDPIYFDSEEERDGYAELVTDEYHEGYFGHEVTSDPSMGWTFDNMYILKDNIKEVY